jgi:ADP-heptose:LPS heptosyltransferase
MKNNNLVLVDMIVGITLIPISIIMRSFRIFSSKIFPLKYKGVLIIKFLGAGNFIAMQNNILSKKTDILSAKSNFHAIAKFNIGNQIFLIDDSNFFKLVITGIICTSKIFFKNYEQVINLEAESKFAKFIASITSTKILSGLSNAHKSYLDLIIYDKYLVSPLMLSKPKIIDLLIKFEKTTNINLENTLIKHRKNFLLNNSLNKINKILIFPTASNTDMMRRLSVYDGWKNILNSLYSLKEVESIEIIFPSKLDHQYSDFLSLSKKYPLTKLIITNYDEFVKKIIESDLLFTVDSQALHIAQHYRKLSIAIYGPTSPFGVNLETTTYPVTQSLICSPCVHKYLRLPCRGEAPCMNFEKSHISIIKYINLKKNI